ncbi:MAG: pyruvoyl-dependent arginine decarboxylase [Bacillota bacterium]
MLPTPTKFKPVSGSACARSALNAFDAALLKAGIGNLNLVKVSSILPPRAKLDPELSIPPGSLVPTAYASIVSTSPGDVIAAAVAVGIAEDPDSFGVIMEYSSHCSAQEAEQTVREMVREGFRIRGMKLKEIISTATECKVDDVAGCAFAAIALWY